MNYNFADQGVNSVSEIIYGVGFSPSQVGDTHGAGQWLACPWNFIVSLYEHGICLFPYMSTRFFDVYYMSAFPPLDKVGLKSIVREEELNTKRCGREDCWAGIIHPSR